MTYITSIFGFLYTNILPFIILLGILIFVHELGHFLVARFCGVRVEVFSLGFGKKILSFKRGDTVYCISLIPLGGYVKMFGEQGSDAVVTDEDKKVSYSHKTPWQRMAVVVAGPLMNFFFAILVFTAIAKMGEQTRSAVLGDVVAGSPAAEMGLKSGDRILKVGESQVLSYEDFQKGLNQHKDSQVAATVEDSQGQQRTLNLSVSSVDNPNIFSLESRLGQIEGLQPYRRSSIVLVTSGSPADKLGFKNGDQISEIDSQKIKYWTEVENLFPLKGQKSISVKVSREPDTSVEISIPAENLRHVKNLAEFGFDRTELYLDQILKDSPAAAAGLQKFDRILSINGKILEKWEDISETVKSFDGKEPLTFTVARGNERLNKQITPKVTENTTPFGGIDKRFTIGITSYLAFVEPEATVVKTASIFESIAKGYSRTVDISVMTVMSFVKLFQGHVSVKNVGGMVSIGKAAKDSFEMGLQSFLMTMGILSVSLFILNLMPIPVLDGGHLVFYIIEVVKGSPLSLRKMEIAQQVGLVLLLGLMILAQFNDIVKFLFKS